MDERAHINNCIAALSKKFHLNASNIQERDFEFVSQKIRTATKVDLSTATLRRIWSGKYQNTPQIKTLDALAQTLGYQGWHAFKIHQKSGKRNSVRLNANYLWLLLLPFIVGFIWVFTKIKTSDGISGVVLQPDALVHEGVPATIGFNYDIQSISGEVKIQLSWIPFEQTVLDPEKQFYTGTYFYPDYHEAKLLLEERVLATSKVHITTPDWHGLLMKEGLDPNPILLNPSEFLSDSSMSVRTVLAQSKGIVASTYFPVFTLSNERLDSVSADQISLQFNARLLPIEIPENCRSFSVLIKGEHGRIRIPISEEGCYGLFDLSVSDHSISGKTTDLSQLSYDFSQITPVAIHTKDQRLFIQVGDQAPFMLQYSGLLGPLKVIKFISTGPGEINTVKFNTYKAPHQVLP